MAATLNYSFIMKAKILENLEGTKPYLRYSWVELKGFPNKKTTSKVACWVRWNTERTFDLEEWKKFKDTVPLELAVANFYTVGKEQYDLDERDKTLIKAVIEKMLLKK